MHTPKKATERTLLARERSRSPRGDGVSILVFVQNAINGDHLATIDADPHDSVAAVKTKIKHLIGHDEWRQKLLKNEVVLEDGVRLSELQSDNDPPTNEVRVSLMLHEGDLVRLAAGTARDPHRAMLILVSGPA